MYKRISSFVLPFVILLLAACAKDKEPDYGFVDVRNTSWEVRGNFNGSNTMILMKFKGLGEGEFGTVTANWIQSGNEIMWLTADNRRFEARLRSSFDMRGDFYDRDGQVPLGSFTARRKD